MKIKILRSASQDLIDGYWFYEKQTDGLGSYFLDSLFSDIDSLIVTAGIHSICYETYHRLLSKRFPFAVYYRVEEKLVLIYGALDCRVSPAWTRRTLGKR